MGTLIVASIIIILYLIPIRFAFLFMQKAYYHKDGRWYDSKPDYEAVIIIFIPFVNIFASVDYFNGEWKNSKIRNEEKEINFFKPKKKL